MELGVCSDDPRSVLRVARLAARSGAPGFTVQQQTIDSMYQLVEAGALLSLTPDQIWEEMLEALSECKPSGFFRVLRACGALKIILPEVDLLFGIPQPPLHHPEVDTGDHVMLCIDVARRRFDSPIVTWAVLVHDLGKGLTPREEWPKHIGHEIRGVPVARAVAERFNVPRDFCELGMLVSEHHLRCHKLLEMRPRSIMRLLEALDAFQKPERVKQFAQACEADARGRLGLEDREYPNGDLLIACAKAAEAVDIQPLLNAGYEGQKLADQHRQLRIKAIAQIHSGRL
ncbi:HD domain-containing protein [Marinobacter sp.]|uniref:HD domain-containing protein n=1 Tax=Marinobacter sp. TaxID=50741 RepID=UPI003A90B1B6